MPSVSPFLPFLHLLSAFKRPFTAYSLRAGFGADQAAHQTGFTMNEFVGVVFEGYSWCSTQGTDWVKVRLVLRSESPSCASGVNRLRAGEVCMK